MDQKITFQIEQALQVYTYSILCIQETNDRLESVREFQKTAVHTHGEIADCIDLGLDAIRGMQQLGESCVATLIRIIVKHPETSMTILERLQIYTEGREFYTANSFKEKFLINYF